MTLCPHDGPQAQAYINTYKYIYTMATLANDKEQIRLALDGKKDFNR